MPQMMPSSWLMIYLFSVIIFLLLMSSWSVFYRMNPELKSKGLNEEVTVKFW